MAVNLRSKPYLSDRTITRRKFLNLGAKGIGAVASTTSLKKLSNKLSQGSKQNPLGIVSDVILGMAGTSLLILPQANTEDEEIKKQVQKLEEEMPRLNRSLMTAIKVQEKIENSDKNPWKGINNERKEQIIMDLRQIHDLSEGTDKEFLGNLINWLK